MKKNVTNDWDVGMREAGKEKRKMMDQYGKFSTGKSGRRGKAESGGWEWGYSCRIQLNWVRANDKKYSSKIA